MYRAPSLFSPLLNRGDMTPDDLVDERGGLIIMPPEGGLDRTHYCNLPKIDTYREPRQDQAKTWEVWKKAHAQWELDCAEAKRYQKVLAYRAACCGRWWYPRKHEDEYMYTRWEWRVLGRWKQRRLRKKGLIPK